MSVVRLNGVANGFVEDAVGIENTLDVISLINLLILRLYDKGKEVEFLNRSWRKNFLG